MTEIILRLTLFTALPALLGAAIVMFDRSAIGATRRAEAFLVPLFLIGVGGSGLSAFIANVFIAEPGSALETQVGFAYLAIGLLGAAASEWRDGFREATVAAVTVFGLGLAYAGFRDFGTTPGNALLGLLHLGLPALLIWFLLAARRAEREEAPTIILRSWTIPVRRASVVAVGIVATAFPVGHATGQLVVLSLAGIVVAAAAFWWIVSRAPSHRANPA